MQTIRVCPFLTVLLLSMLLLIFSLATPSKADLTWSTQIVDANAVAIGNGYGSVVIDSNDIPYMGYSPGYAVLNGSGWLIQERFCGFVTDLKLDANDNPHILITNGVLGPLDYICWTGTEWHTQTIPSTSGHNIVFASLALDSFGNPHVAYTYGDGLKYASWNGSDWDIQTVDTSFSEISFQLSLSLNNNNVPYIMYMTTSSYVDSSGNNVHSKSIKLAVLKDSGWSVESVLDSYNLFDCWNMVLDSNGYPRFLGKQISQDGFADILYVCWNGSAWNVQTVVSKVEWNIDRGFLALDSYDFPSFVYVEGGERLVGAGWSGVGERLMYATWTGLDWNIQTVNTNVPTVTWTGAEWKIRENTNDPIVSIYGPCYLAIDSNGCPHISFRGTIFHQTKWHEASILYATATGSSPRVVNVESNSTVSAFSFDGNKSVLAFNVTGELGTTGYANVSVAKSYLSDVDDLKVYLDEEQVDFQVSSNESSWVLAFTYPHSTHQVRINFAIVEAEVSETTFPTVLLGGIIVAAIVIVLAVLTAATHWKKPKKSMK